MAVVEVKREGNLLADSRHFQEEMDLLFNHFYELRYPPMLTSERLWRPPMDVLETETEVLIVMEVAGMRNEDFNITVKDDILTIQGQRLMEEKQRKAYYRNMEINFGPFERNVYLPQSVNTNDISATYRDGFLVIKVRKGPRELPQELTIKIE
jgi:HSP20 family protein